MKFIHISDTHLVADRRGHYASDPAYKLQRAVQSINKYFCIWVSRMLLKNGLCLFGIGL